MVYIIYGVYVHIYIYLHIYIYVFNHRLVYAILWLNTWNYTLYKMGNVKKANAIDLQ